MLLYGINLTWMIVGIMFDFEWHMVVLCRACSYCKHLLIYKAGRD